ncbi:MAG TPA: oxidoreductase, partial [Halomonas sp.]|nr:oxidoreductase [Halomonas sp.]
MTKPHTYYVTGGAQGIGLGIAHLLLAEGHRVAITDIDEEALDAAAKRLPNPSQLLALTADVSDEAQVAASLEKAVSHFG